MIENTVSHLQNLLFTPRETNNCSLIFLIRENNISMKIMYVYVQRVESEEEKKPKVNILQTIYIYKLNLALAHTQ